MDRVHTLLQIAQCGHDRRFKGPTLTNGEVSIKKDYGSLNGTEMPIKHG